jgi:repressor LexA
MRIIASRTLTPSAIVLHPANSSLKPMRYHPDQVRVQGVLVGQMRHYH